MHLYTHYFNYHEAITEVFGDFLDSEIVNKIASELFNTGKIIFNFDQENQRPTLTEYTIILGKPVLTIVVFSITLGLCFFLIKIKTYDYTIIVPVLKTKLITYLKEFVNFLKA